MITRNKVFRDKPKPKTELQKAVAKAKREKHEKAFEFMWNALGGPFMRREYVFCERRWRFDFAQPGTKVAVEIEGGVWSGGRHTNGAGYVEDCTKYNRASVLGWTVFRLTPEMITREKVLEIINFVKEASK